MNYIKQFEILAQFKTIAAAKEALEVIERENGSDYSSIKINEAKITITASEDDFEGVSIASVNKSLKSSQRRLMEIIDECEDLSVVACETIYK